MPREIKKKIIDKSIKTDQATESRPGSPGGPSAPAGGGIGLTGFSADFSIEDELAGAGMGNEFPTDDGRESSHGFSLDEFEMPTMGEEPVSESPDKPVKSKKKVKAAPDPQALLRRKIMIRKAVMIGVPALVLLLAGVFVVRLVNRPSPPPPPVPLATFTAPVPRPTVTLIRKAVDFPHYQEQVNFFLLAVAQEEKNILDLGLEFEFNRSDRHQHFVDENTLFRDVVYRFLLTRKPARNTIRDWQKIVQNDLADHIRSSLPQSQVDQIRVYRMEKL